MQRHSVPSTSVFRVLDIVSNLRDKVLKKRVGLRAPRKEFCLILTARSVQRIENKSILH